MPFIEEGSRRVLRKDGGPASCLAIPMMAVGVGLTLVGGKNVLQHLDVVRGVEAVGLVVAALSCAAGVALMLFAAVATLARREVILDTEQRTVRTEARVIFRMRGRVFAFADFDRVEVVRGAGLRGGRGAAFTSYVPALKGPRASIRLEHLSQREANAQALEVARWMGVRAVPSADA